MKTHFQPEDQVSDATQEANPQILSASFTKGRWLYLKTHALIPWAVLLMS